MSLLREVRDLCEMLRFLNYTHNVCAEHFRQPNFNLVVDILLWLMEKYNPASLNQDDSIKKPEDSGASRLIFLRDIVRFFARNAQIILDSRKLYKADFEAAVELKKITANLKDSLTSNNNSFHNDDDTPNVASRDVSRSSLELYLEKARQTIKQTDFSKLASNILESAETLAESLQKELDNTKQRNLIIERRLELDEVDKVMKSQQSEFVQLNLKLDKTLKNITTDLTDIETKLERKQTEVLHAKERLEALQAIAPSHKEELDKLNDEMDRVYDVYVSRYRCLTYLDHELKKSSESTGKILRQLPGQAVSADDDTDIVDTRLLSTTTKQKSQIDIPDLADDIQKSINDVIKSRRAQIGLNQQHMSASESLDSNKSIKDDEENDIATNEEDDDDVLDLNTDEEFSSLFN